MLSPCIRSMYGMLPCASLRPYYTINTIDTIGTINIIIGHFWHYVAILFFLPFRRFVFFVVSLELCR